MQSFAIVRLTPECQQTALSSRPSSRTTTASTGTTLKARQPPGHPAATANAQQYLHEGQREEAEDMDRNSEEGVDDEDTAED